MNRSLRIKEDSRSFAGIGKNSKWISRHYDEFKKLQEWRKKMADGDRDMDDDDDDDDDDGGDGGDDNGDDDEEPNRGTPSQPGTSQRSQAQEDEEI